GHRGRFPDRLPSAHDGASNHYRHCLAVSRRLPPDPGYRTPSQAMPVSQVLRMDELRSWSDLELAPTGKPGSSIGVSCGCLYRNLCMGSEASMWKILGIIEFGRGIGGVIRIMNERRWRRVRFRTWQIATINRIGPRSNTICPAR